MSKISQHSQLAIWFILFISSFIILMTVLAYKGYQEQLKGRLAIEYLLKEKSLAEYHKYLKETGIK